jgi:hypothetical protein
MKGALLATFDQLDADRSGYIEVSELQRLLRAIGLEELDNDRYFTVLRHLMKDYDVDSDGRLSREEYNSGLVPRLEELLAAQQREAERVRALDIQSRGAQQSSAVSRRREEASSSRRVCELEAELEALKGLPEPSLLQLLGRVAAASPEMTAEFVDGILTEAIRSRPEYVADLLKATDATK